MWKLVGKEISIRKKIYHLGKSQMLIVGLRQSVEKGREVTIRKFFVV
jgi:hypothetical protein